MRRGWRLYCPALGPLWLGADILFLRRSYR